MKRKLAHCVLVILCLSVFAFLYVLAGINGVLVALAILAFLLAGIWATAALSK